MAAPLDCLIIGAGPAGLTAGLYLARYRRSLAILDSGASRARWIPRSHNAPGFPEGVSGPDLLAALRRQLETYGPSPRLGHIDALARSAQGFSAQLDGEVIEARTVILATGVVEIVPPIPGAAEAIHKGVLRVCPVCDGYEAQGRTVAVMGSGEHAAREALFLRTWARSVTLLVGPDDALAPSTLAELERLAVSILRLPAEALRLEEGGAVLPEPSGTQRRFDLIYSAFGVTPQVKLVRDLGLDLDPDGRIRVDEHQQTAVDGLYAAGDVVRGLNQISVAVGEAAVAATAVHNRLARNPC